MTPTPAQRRRCLGAAGSVGVVVGGLLWAAVLASGQEVQPLTYRTSDKIEEVVGSTGGQTLEWGWQAPTGATFPAMAPGQPVFARWLTPRVPGGTVHLALHPSRADGPYDRLFIDGNVDSHLENEPSTAASKVTATRNGQSVEFRQVVVLLSPSGEIAPTPYHLDVRLTMNGRKPVKMAASAAGWREGQVTIDKSRILCVLLDADANGAFNNLGGSCGPGDLIRLGDPSDVVPMPVTKSVRIGDRYFTLEIAQDGSFVKFTPLGPGGLGALQMPADIRSVRLGGQTATLALNAKDGRVVLPAGDYHVDGWTQVRTDKSGKVWTLTATAGTLAAAAPVADGEVTQLDIGDPVTATMDVERTGVDTYAFTHPMLIGRSGERVTLTVGRRAVMPKVITPEASGIFWGRSRFTHGGKGDKVVWEFKLFGRGQQFFIAQLDYEGPFRIVPLRYRLEEGPFVRKVPWLLDRRPWDKQ